MLGAMALITRAALFVLALQAVHGLDHLLWQDRALEGQVAALGVAESGAVTLALALALAAAGARCTLARREGDAAPG